MQATTEKPTGGQRLESEKVIDGVVHVWSVFDNAWVPLDYWNWVNGQRRHTTTRPKGADSAEVPAR